MGHRSRFVGLVELAVVGWTCAATSPAQDTDFVSLTPQGTLPMTGASGSVAAFGVSADGSVIAFTSFATDVIPGVTSSGQTYVRDRRHATTLLASQSSSGVEGNSQSIPMDVSWSGRWILFRSQAGNLDPLDVNPAADVFLRDLESDTTSIVSLGAGGQPANAAAGYFGAVSGDGRVVAFDSWASNWVAGDANNVRDVYRRDRTTGAIELVSVALGGGAGNGESFVPHMSDDGRFVVFASAASDLVPGDSNGRRDCFLRDVAVGTTILLSADVSGAGSNGDSNSPEVSNDGRFVAFESAATDLVAGDTNSATDVFVRDVIAGTTQRVSLGLGGVELDHMSTQACMSADGTLIAFASRGANHGFGDLNGHGEDVFLAERTTGMLWRASQNSAGAQAVDECGGPRLAADGRSVVFASYAWNLGSFPDTNNFVDTFVHDAFPPAIQPYCTAKTSANGCLAAMSGEGAASVSAPAPFPVRAENLDNQRPGLIFFGFSAASLPFQGGTMCVGFPHVRTTIQSSGGDLPPASNCSGVLSVDFNAVIQSGATPQLVAGAVVFCQAWYRDPSNFFHSALSDGLLFPILP
jgi:Tol biopolymer transport system component